PSWFTADPRTTANTGCPFRRASESRSTTSSPTPSDHPVPSAAAANDLHRPSGANPRCRLKSKNVIGVDITATPPANASEHSPAPRHANTTPTRDTDPPVPPPPAGPKPPTTNDTRPDNTLAEPPVSRWPSTGCTASSSAGP